ncbi:MAG: DUF1707 domain-containing protein [Actinomycetota bacterium]
MTSISYDPREQPPHLRASDSQREVVAELVQRAASDGRLQLPEVDERLGAVYQAKTHGELGAIIDDLVPRRPRVPAPRWEAPVPVPGVSEKRILPAVLLCFFVGPLGVHRFYAGKVGTGALMLGLTLSLVGIVVTSVWALIDLIVLIVGAFRDGRGLPLRLWT